MLNLHQGRKSYSNFQSTSTDLLAGSKTPPAYQAPRHHPVAAANPRRNSSSAWRGARSCSGSVSSKRLSTRRISLSNIKRKRKRKHRCIMPRGRPRRAKHQTLPKAVRQRRLPPQRERKLARGKLHDGWAFFLFVNYSIVVRSHLEFNRVGSGVKPKHKIPFSVVDHITHSLPQDSPGRKWTCKSLECKTVRGITTTSVSSAHLKAPASFFHIHPYSPLV